MQRWTYRLMLLGVVASAGTMLMACDSELSDRELIRRARHARGTSETIFSEESGGSNANTNSNANADSKADAGTNDSPSSLGLLGLPEGSPDAGRTGSASSSKNDGLPELPPDAGRTHAEMSRDAHLGFCTYEVRQKLSGKSLVSTLDGRIAIDDQKRVLTVSARTAFQGAERELLDRYEMVRYGETVLEAVNHELPTGSKRTRLTLVAPEHNLVRLQRDTDGDGSYDESALFVYGGAPTDVLISGTSYMLTNELEEPLDGFSFEYDDQGRVVRAEQTRGDRKGRTVQFSYAYGYFRRLVERDANGNQKTLWMVDVDSRGRPTEIKKKLDTTGAFNAIQKLTYDCNDR